MLTPGDPAPWFTARSTVNPRFTLDTEAGRYLVLCFFGSAADPAYDDDFRVAKVLGLMTDKDLNALLA